MSRGSLSQVINDFLQALGLDLPWWSGLAMVLAIFIVFLPQFIQTARSQRARKLLKQAGYEDPELRRKNEQKAILLVKNNPQGLLALAEEALRNKNYDQADRILRLVPQKKKKYRYEIRRLRKKMAPRGELTPLSAASAIKSLIESGLFESADERLRKALLRWPAAKELHELALLLESR